MSRVWRAWVELWDRREDAAGLALVRIGLGLVLAYDLVDMWRVGAIDALLARPPEGYAVADVWLGPHATWAAALVAALAIAFGVAARAACVAFVALSLQLAQAAPDGERGIDQLARVVLVILALSRCNARWSVDAVVWRRLGRPIPHVVPAWPRYLLLLQLVWVYASGGMNKAGAEWGPAGGFAALGNALADPHMARFGPGWVEVAMPLTRVATAATMLFELSAPLYIGAYYVIATRDGGRLHRAAVWYRRAWIALGVAFHVGIAIFLRLGIFPLGMLALYPVLLLPRRS